jgi:alpha,alpha-trehalase
MKKLLIAAAIFLPSFIFAQKRIATPDILYGELFKDIQIQQILPDGKTFVDCTPKRKIAEIMYDYGLQKGPNMNLKKFVEDNFTIPSTIQFNYIQKEANASIHIKNLWAVLKRNPDKGVEGSSLLPLPAAYIVPGGRFREIYYWDSYFTMLGLKESGEVQMIENMVKNFAYLIDVYGHIPNGNRNYYISRSQPPFFCLMVELLASIKGKQVYKTYLPAMEKEYAYWMEGASTVKKDAPYKRVVQLKDGTILNRYWDDNTTPRQESYKEDFELSEAVAQELAMRVKMASPEKLKELLDNCKANTNRNLRAGACSGWDFSSRWFADEKTIKTIETTNIIPVDLNCLLYSMESIIATASLAAGKKSNQITFAIKAAKRKAAILKYCWSKDLSYFVDYNFLKNANVQMVTAAGMFPLFVKIASNNQAILCANTITTDLVKPGGLVTTKNNTGQQWDAPNGWAPLQWVAIKGLSYYKQDELATTIATRWLALNDKVYQATGKLMEKYNVEDMSQLAGGGEYPTQDGFGWTNGVYLALKKLYNK